MHFYKIILHIQYEVLYKHQIVSRGSAQWLPKFFQNLSQF
jgi:hypothetical protein